MMKERILNAIEKEAMRTGKMGTEQVEVTLNLTDEEKAEFLNLDDFDSEHYTWDFEGNELSISYAEEVM